MKIRNDVAAFLSLRPANYRFVKLLSFSREIEVNENGRFNVELVLSGVLDDSVKDIKITFFNVCDVKISDIESMFGVLVDIEDIKQDQIEGVSYRVVELENDVFSFLCSDFDVDL